MFKGMPLVRLPKEEKEAFFSFVQRSGGVGVGVGVGVAVTEGVQQIGVPQ